MILRPVPIPTSRLTWVAADRQYVGEISDTRGFGRVWDDACDEGLTLVSPTGREVVFYVSTTERDAEGDVTAWLLRVADRAAPLAYADVTIRLFND